MCNQIKSQFVELSLTDQLVFRQIIVKTGSCLPVWIDLCAKHSKFDRKELECLLRDLDEFVSLYFRNQKLIPHFFITSFIESFELIINKLPLLYNVSKDQIFYNLVESLDLLIDMKKRLMS